MKKLLFNGIRTTKGSNLRFEYSEALLNTVKGITPAASLLSLSPGNHQ
jgi:hypothetical protein